MVVTTRKSVADVNARNAELPGGPVPPEAFVRPDFSGESCVVEVAGLVSGSTFFSCKCCHPLGHERW